MLVLNWIHKYVLYKIHHCLFVNSSLIFTTVSSNGQVNISPSSLINILRDLSWDNTNIPLCLKYHSNYINICVHTCLFFININYYLLMFKFFPFSFLFLILNKIFMLLRISHNIFQSCYSLFTISFQIQSHFLTHSSFHCPFCWCCLIHKHLLGVGNYTRVWSTY